ncbi:MAG: BACON domain-containing protein, partial [Ktedonobacterales bacterium]
KLGDALVAAGLPARSWLGPAARLRLLDDTLPDVTVDDVISRLAEFAAGMAPGWLRGDRASVARFNAEVATLDGVTHGLRLAAQRERMASLRGRSGNPLPRAFGDARVGTQLDLLARDLRDLAALAPFLAPLSAAEWQEITGGQRVDPARIAAPAPAAVAPPAAPQAYTRLRDFAAPSSSGAGMGRAPVLSVRLGEAMGRVRVSTQALAARVSPRRWLAVGVVALALVLATGLLTLVNSPSQTSAPALSATPATISLGCSTKAAAVKLTLRNTTKAALVWSVSPATGVQVSITHGTLKANTSVALTVTAHGAKASKGTLAFIAGNTRATVAYSVTCP